MAMIPSTPLASWTPEQMIRAADYMGKAARAGYNAYQSLPSSSTLRGSPRTPTGQRKRSHLRFDTGTPADRDWETLYPARAALPI